MVTSNNFPEKKVFKMSEKSPATGAPHRTQLGEVNAHLTCFICRGYYIDATTIVECLHSFCRSCIMKHLQAKSYCPVCEMMINSAKPNIKPDKALQDIVYKLVPGLFQKEMERRRKFYASRPGPAASATPEQRGEDTERIIFSPEDVISFSLEYADATDSDSISSKSSDGNEQPPTDSSRRFLQCPAVVNISHLKKFLCMKFDIDSTQYSLDILYKRIPLPEYYTLMDIAYIYNWKRNKPLRFVYQVMDYLAMRNRYNLFDIKRKKSKCQENPPTVDDVGPDSPSLLTQGHVSDESSGIDSPMLDDIDIKTNDTNNKLKIESECFIKSEPAIHKHDDEDEEKSQFLNSFELTAKNNSSPEKSPTKLKKKDPELNKEVPTTSINKTLNATNSLYIDDNLLKRKHSALINVPDNKKNKTDFDITPKPTLNKTDDLNTIDKNRTTVTTSLLCSTPFSNTLCTPKDNLDSPILKPKKEENQTPFLKRPVPGAQKIQDIIKPISNQISEKQIVSPIKIQFTKTDVPSVITKPTNLPKPPVKKMPELKLGFAPSRNQLKVPVTKVRMDLLANNCDPTMDRSKILPHMQSPMPTKSSSPTSGDPLKSLFDSCKINIPSSLSITLTDQKLDSRVPEKVKFDTLPPFNNTKLKEPSQPVHNYIEILKLPDTDPKQTQTKIELSNTSKLNVSSKQSDTPSAKGPIPSLKPIGETKLAKLSGNFPVTSPYQQKYIQSLEQSKASKINVPRVRMQVPNLMPANVKQLNAAANKESFKAGNSSKYESKAPRSDVLDLSISHNFQTQQTQLKAQCNMATSDPQKLSAGPSFSVKTMRPVSSTRHPVPNSLNKTILNTSTSDLNLQPPMYPQVMLRHLEWFKTQQARHEYEKIINNMPKLNQNYQDFNKDKP